MRYVNKIKRFACVFPHSDDLAIFAGGLVTNLIEQGAECYWIRVTDDDKDSWDLSGPETAAIIEEETQAVKNQFGIKSVFDLGYLNHYMNETHIEALRHRIAIIIRMLKLDAVISFDPWAKYEENPDHRITGMAVDQASWIAARGKDLPEMQKLGIKPHTVTARAYTARGSDLHDVTHHLRTDQFLSVKRRALLEHRTPLNNMILGHEAPIQNDGLGKTISPHDGTPSEQDRMDFVDNILLPSRCKECDEGLICEPYHIIGEIGGITNA